MAEEPVSLGFLELRAEEELFVAAAQRYICRLSEHQIQCSHFASRHVTIGSVDVVVALGKFSDHIKKDLEALLEQALKEVGGTPAQDTIPPPRG